MATRVLGNKCVQSTERDIVNGSLCDLCHCVGSWASVTYLRYTGLMNPKKHNTAIYCCDPALSTIVMSVSRNVFHVVSALQCVVCSSKLSPATKTKWKINNIASQRDQCIS